MIFACSTYFFLVMIMFPYTSKSLKRKNCRGFGRFLHAFVNTPSPTRTRPGTLKGCPAFPKQFSTNAIRLAFASLFTETFNSFSQI